MYIYIHTYTYKYPIFTHMHSMCKDPLFFHLQKRDVYLYKHMFHVIMPFMSFMCFMSFVSLISVQGGTP